VWVHAASVGEVRAAEALYAELSPPRLLTVDTAEGLAVGRSFAGPAAALLPMDHPWLLAPLFADARPRALLFVEGTWWPALAKMARRAGVPVYRVSAKSGPRTRRVPRRLLRWWWRDATAVWARDQGSAAFLEGCHRCEVSVGGDLKDSVRPGRSPLRWPGPFVVGMSLRGDDDLHLLAARPPGHRVLLAPRHPATYDPARLAGHRWVRRSLLTDGTVPGDVEVVWLDTLGELGSCVRGAAAAFVGGTFDPAIGGHSPREAQAVGVPVVHGPHTQAAPGAFRGATEVAAAGELSDALRRLVRGPRPAPVAGTSARRIATLVEERTGPPARETSPRPWAAPLTRPWAWAAATRSWVGRRRAVSVPVPVISVGSTNARSPGRTSSVRWLLGELSRRGEVVGVALRGYRRAGRGRGVRVSWAGAGADDLGDEGALLARCGAAVAAGPDRVAAATRLVAHGCTVVVVDDGLQYQRLARDIDIAVVDARFPTARGLLPMGERREAEAIPARADRVWVHHGSGRFGCVGEPVHRLAAGWERGGQPAGAPDRVAVWFCAVGHPAQVLASYDGEVADVWLAPDHHIPDPEALRRWVGDRALLTTAKDLTRLPRDLQASAWVRPLRLQAPEVDWLEPLLQRRTQR